MKTTAPAIGDAVRISGCPKKYSSLDGQIATVVGKLAGGWVTLSIGNEEINLRNSCLELVGVKNQQIADHNAEVGDEADDINDHERHENDSLSDNDNEKDNDSIAEEIATDDDADDHDDDDDDNDELQEPIGTKVNVTCETDTTLKDEVCADGDSDDDGDKMEELVDKALQNFKSSKFQPRSKVFSALHKRLLGSGRIISSNLKATEGIIREQKWKKGAINFCINLP
jgi:hypothetical protein